MEEGKIRSVDVDEVMQQARTEAKKAFDLVDLDDFKPSDRTFWHGTRYERDS
jgi:hypothetical protein